MDPHDVFYRAMMARDVRFDGKFFVGVKTTGVYCRPICPARPKRENVEFFPQARAAEKAGYRPCLRCQPEAAPLSPAWQGTSAIVRRAVRKIHSQEALALNEDAFAALFGVGGRHLRRLFMEEIGKTPKQIAMEHRLNFSRTLIAETAMPMTEIAYASGFQSIRRFNAAFKSRFKRSPSEIRRNNVALDAPLILPVPYRPPFNYERVLAFFRSHQVGGLEQFEGASMTRVLHIDGAFGRVRIANDAPRNRLLVDIDFPRVSDIPAIISRVRQVFDLDSDPLLIANAFEAEPALAEIFRKHPGLRVPMGWDPFEAAVGTILGQFVSVERARQLVADLIAHYGRPSEYMLGGGPVTLFPTPERLVRSDLKHLKTTGQRKATLRDFARAVVRGTISLEGTQDVEGFRNALLAIKGIGPWTADYMCMRVLGHADAFPASDLILARALQLHPEDSIDRVRPWRGYAAVLLWSEYAHQLTRTPKMAFNAAESNGGVGEPVPPRLGVRTRAKRAPKGRLPPQRKYAVNVRV